MMMPTPSHTIKSKYEVNLRPLLDLNEASKIENMVGPLQEPLHYLNPLRLLRTELPLKKRVHRYLKGLVDRLDDLREETLFEPAKLSELQKIVEMILSQDKTHIIKELLLRNCIADEKTDNLINKIEKKMCCILSTPKISQTHALMRAQTITPYTPQINPFSFSLSNQVKKQKAELSKSLIVSRFKRFSPEKIEDWERMLLKGFENIQSPEELKTAMSGLQNAQIGVLFDHILEEPQPDWKMVHFLASLQLNHWFPILHSLTYEQMTGLSKVLKEKDREVLVPLESASRILRDAFIEVCNSHKKLIDELAHLLRTIEIIDLSRSELLEIEKLLSDIRLDREAVKRYHGLIEDVIDDSETLHSLSDLDNEYSLFETRLTEDDDETPGCLYGIIHRRAFGDLDDDEDSIEIFGNWKIFYPEDYKEVGLIETISTSHKTDYELGRKKMEDLGLSTIFSLKKNKIYNRVFLQEFIRQKQAA